MPLDRPTIQAGIDAAENGDTVLVAPGTYKENIDFKGKAISVTSGATRYEDATATVIQAPNAGPAVAFQTGETATSVINGFTITHEQPSSGQLFGDGVAMASASATVSNNIIRENISCGISAVGAAAFAIVGNYITGQLPNSGTNCSTPNVPHQHTLQLALLMLVDSGDATITSNLVENGDGTGSNTTITAISVRSVALVSNIIRNNKTAFTVALSDVHDIVIVQNLLYGNASAFPVSVGHFTTQQNISFPLSLVVVNNTFSNPVHMPYSGIQLFIDAPLTSGTIANNLLYDPVDTAPALVCTSPEGAGTVIKNNDASPVGSSVSSSGCQAQYLANVSLDPHWIGSASGNYRVQATSPVIAAGDITVPDLPAADLDGKNRMVCGTVDQGAYQTHPHPPITLTTSINPLPGGNNVTFTAQLTGNCNVPTGAVTFFDGATPIGSGTLNGSALASLTTAFLVVGQHTITAYYPGDFNFDDSTSNAVNETVTGFSTATSLTVAPNPATAFQTISMSAKETAPYGTPSGTVTFLANGKALGTAALSGSGVATFGINTLAAGTYNVVAVFNATTQYATSSSATVVEVVLGATSSVTLRAAPNPISLGQNVALTALVVPSQGGSPIPAGTITFQDSGVSIGTATLSSSGLAVLNTSALALGSHTITASYSGSGNYNAELSNAVVVVVTTIPTAISVTGSPNPANLGAAVTFTATAMANGIVSTPSALVTFADAGAPIGTAQLGPNGVAIFSTSTLSAGTHPITAALGGGSTFGSSVSLPLAEVITAYDFSVSVTPATITLPPGGYTTLSVNLVPLGGYTGTVQLSCGTLPAHAQCVFSQTSASLAKGQQTVSLTLNTSDVYEYGTKVGRSEIPPEPGGSRPPLYGVMLLPLLAFSRVLRRKMNVLRGPVRLLALVIAATALFALQACAGHQPGETVPGTYQIQVTGMDSSSTQVHTAVANVTVTP